MRKRSKYRPRPVLRDPVGYVLAGVSRIDAHEAAVPLRVRNNSALESLIQGNAATPDVAALIALANVSTAFARLGKGQDWRAEIRAGVDAVEAVRNRAERWGKVQATATELQAIATLIDIHDAQLSDSAVVHLEAALDLVQKKQAVAV